MQTLDQLLSGELKGTRHLRLSCNLTRFPEEIFSLSGTLEVLDLSMNQLSALPADFGRLSKLKIAFFSDNLFTELPEVLGDCKALSMIGFKSNKISYVSEKALPETTRWLILTNNRLVALPASIGKCMPLQKVALAGNKLKDLPEEMANCKNLELLRISANDLKELPGWLLHLPKLSWLAFSGNPLSHVPENINALNEISWTEFEIRELLGEGASGQIYKALWKNKNSETEVAIKVFKGEVTSDGFPEDEMQATIVAGEDPGLVKLMGKIKDHPSQKQGLVMALIPSSFSNLGLPPSLETCSRDTFPAGTEFSAFEILKILTAIASTAKHLHGKGILHGDLYAHNILVDKNFRSLMSDFGAASFFSNDRDQTVALQKMESRALGCLLDGLLMNLKKDENKNEITGKLKGIRDQLMTENLSERILVTEALEHLKSIKH